VTSSKDDADVAARRLAEVSATIVEGVERELPGWVQREVQRIVDAWGRLDAHTRAEVGLAAQEGARAATERVSARLRELFATDLAAQRATPLEIVRTAYREPSEVLERAGIPPVERSVFDERMWPDDRYGLVPYDLGDLGDPQLAPLMLAWGMTKARLLRLRAAG